MPTKYHARTKIVGTLGPASTSRETIRGLIDAGLNVARINFSHGTHEQHAERVRLVREAAREAGCAVAILGDLQGPRIRIGDLEAPVPLEAGEEIVLYPEGEPPAVDEGDARQLPITYEALADDVSSGDRILVDDGLIELVVLAVEGRRVRARVVHGGPVKSHKGMNLPGVSVSAPSITDKDRADVQFVIEHQLDYVALSFVRRAEDVESLRALLPKGILIVAKIEKDQALDNIEEIVRATDAVMVARGDLGVELPFERVPLAQKQIIEVSQRHGRPVITATQMLESMIEHPRPTRAEASDVANAILDGTDAVMLSAETAAGKYPNLAVQAMRRIIAEIEAHPAGSAAMRDERRVRGAFVATENAIAAATVAAARQLGTPLVCVFTKSGFSARVVSSHRPPVPILALTDTERTARQLALVWGVVPELVPHQHSYDEMIGVALDAAVKRELAVPGDRVVVTAGVPFDEPGTTNTLKVEVVPH
ncbi:pyruvate kinase [Gemmatirosa kalamazoonensis]|uniref:Pyruvate kinase n=1 Tax=Gemmatirosa kalamazoonensis TaxID=861299 RepID=W0RLU2_9BACT|nr:pyruvate kinase [Gemmatirosa kalamazoonensis]AHG90408.1 pyruvate kinase [Gemmatirosa kalamazoonensis]